MGRWPNPGHLCGALWTELPGHELNPARQLEPKHSHRRPHQRRLPRPETQGRGTTNAIKELNGTIRITLKTNRALQSEKLAMKSTG